MKTPVTVKQLNIASLGALVAAFGLSVPVAERIVAAIWQWYKFAGHSNNGHINLSLHSGLLFSCIVVAVFGVALLLHRLAKLHSANRAVTWSQWAMYVALAVFAAYWLLGVSGLNAWRA